VSKGAPGSRLGAVAETAGPRFRERIITPTKHWKMSAEDIRNRARRSDYLAALDNMFDPTAVAPCYVVSAEYKWFARIAVAKTAVKTLAKGITMAPPALDPEVLKLATKVLGRKELAVLARAAAAGARGQ